MTCALNRWLFPVVSLTFLLIVPARASAQSGSENWSGLRSSNLQTVYVLDRSGTETSGKLLGLNPDSLVLLVDGTERRFDMATVARVQKRDSLKNGTIVGAIVGVAMGLAAAGISDCPGDDPGGSCGGVRAATFAVSAGMYTAIGAGIDALIRGRSTIYAAPTSSLTRAALIGRAAPRGALQIGFSW
jgi:hypothetical protein